MNTTLKQPVVRIKEIKMTPKKRWKRFIPFYNFKGYMDTMAQKLVDLGNEVDYIDYKNGHIIIKH